MVKFPEENKNLEEDTQKFFEEKVVTMLQKWFHLLSVAYLKYFV